MESGQKTQPPGPGQACLAQARAARPGPGWPAPAPAATDPQPPPLRRNGKREVQFSSVQLGGLQPHLLRECAGAPPFAVRGPPAEEHRRERQAPDRARADDGAVRRAQRSKADLENSRERVRGVKGGGKRGRREGRVFSLVGDSVKRVKSHPTLDDEG